jgi:uncharacterized repeat protein (TIGR03803 family)
MKADASFLSSRTFVLWCSVLCLAAFVVPVVEAKATPRNLSRQYNQSQSAATPEQVLYAFQGGNDGYTPSSSLISDSSGNLYGTTSSGGGGSCACGTVFELSPSTSGTWSETVIYRFQGGTDGSLPSSGLILDQAGNLYGTTSDGGPDDAGTVYELTPNGAGGWTETILYSFQGAPDGAQPNGVVFDQLGNLYGTTAAGGNALCDSDQNQDCGTIFELIPNGGGSWTEKILYEFPSLSADGYVPTGGLIFDQSGNLYGTTGLGGTGQCVGIGGCGTAFELSPAGGGAWTFTLLYSFQGGAAGNYPNGALVLDGSGNLYGTTQMGGSGQCSSDGCGTVFKLSPNGSASTETTLYSFRGGTDGNYPAAGLIFDSTGNLYGTTRNGGDATCNSGNGCGTVFELSPSQSGAWAEALLYNFKGGNDGQTPSSGLIFDQAGNLYGTTQFGGSTACHVSYGCGVAFEVAKMPLATFSPSSVTFPGQYVGSSGASQPVTVKNTGTAALAITGVTASPSDFSVSNSCGSSLSVGQSCSIGVSFDPTTSGTRNGTLTITDNAPGGSQSIPLSGVGEDFSLTASSPSQTVSPGESASYSISVSPQGGFNQKVQLGCSGTPSGYTCSVSPATTTLNGSASQTVMVAVTPAVMAAGLVTPAKAHPLKSYGMWLALSGFFGLAWIMPIRTRRRGYGSLCMLTLVCLLTILMPACGGANSSSPTPQAGSYALTVTGTFTSGNTNLTHTAKLTLVVN